MAGYCALALWFSLAWHTKGLYHLSFKIWLDLPTPCHVTPLTSTSRYYTKCLSYYLTPHPQNTKIKLQKPSELKNLTSKSVFRSALPLLVIQHHNVYTHSTIRLLGQFSISSAPRAILYKDPCSIIILQPLSFHNSC